METAAFILPWHLDIIVIPIRTGESVWLHLKQLNYLCFYTSTEKEGKSEIRSQKSEVKLQINCTRNWKSSGFEIEVLKGASKYLEKGNYCSYFERGDYIYIYIFFPYVGL